MRRSITALLVAAFGTLSSGQIPTAQAEAFTIGIVQANGRTPGPAKLGATTEQ